MPAVHTHVDSVDPSPANGEHGAALASTTAPSLDVDLERSAGLLCEHLHRGSEQVLVRPEHIGSRELHDAVGCDAEILEDLAGAGADPQCAANGDT